MSGSNKTTRTGYLATADGVKKLKQAKKNKKYTYLQIAKEAHETEDKVKRLFNPHWGNGQYKVGEQAIERICYVLDLKPEEIVYDWDSVETDQKYDQPYYRALEKIEEAYNQAHLLLLPSQTKTYNGIMQALSKGLPVLSYRGEERETLIDLTCGMLIDYMSTGQSIGDFANLLRMLYFDPAACKILKKGALKKYTTLLQWQQPTKNVAHASAAS